MNATKKLLLGLLFFTCAVSQAQVSVNVNLGSPPAWGPAGYTDVRYYYLPDIETYYDVGTRQYIYVNNGAWTRAKVLPATYRTYNLYDGYKVVVNDYRGTTPYVYYKDHKVKYPKGYKGGKQKTIGLPPGQAKKMTATRSSSHKVVHSNGNAGKKGKGNGNGKGKGKN
jgi:hypothetical protein